jgi:hypothetical protein
MVQTNLPEDLISRLLKLERDVADISKRAGLGNAATRGTFTVLDGAGNAIIEIGRSADGLYGIRVNDTSGNPQIRLGQLASTGYGLEAVAGGSLVNLSALALGLATGAVVINTDNTSSYRVYVDLANVGPSVTVNVSSSGKALALWSCRASMSVTAASPLVGSGVSVAVSGATTIAADDNWVAAWESQVGNSTSNAASTTLSRMHLFTGLNQGSTTFKMQYASWASGGSANFWARELVVLPF